MCEPASIIAGVSIGTSLLGTGASLVGQAQASEEAQRQGRENAKQARIAASDALARGNQEAGLVRQQASQVIGEQKVTAASAGFDPSVGSPLAAMADTRLMSELDAAQIHENARRESDSYLAQGRNFQRQAASARRQLPFQQAGTFLGGVSQSAGMAYNAFRNGSGK